MPDQPIEFEHDFDEPSAATLARLGLNALACQRAMGPDFVESLRPAAWSDARSEFLNPRRLSEIAMLSGGMREAFRRHKRSDSGIELYEELPRALAGLVPATEQGRCRLPWAVVELDWTRPYAGLVFRLGGDTGPGGRELVSSVGRIGFQHDLPALPVSCLRFMLLMETWVGYEGDNLPLESRPFPVTLSHEYLDGAMKRLYGEQLSWIRPSGSPSDPNLVFWMCPDSLRSFDPEEIAMRSKYTRDLLSERSELATLAFLANVHRTREEALRHFAGRRDGVRALIFQMQAFEEARLSNGPIEPELLESRLGGWGAGGLSDPKNLGPRISGALECLAGWTDSSPELFGDAREFVLAACLREIDSRVSKALAPLLSQTEFRELEARWRAIERFTAAVDEPNAVCLLPFETGCFSRLSRTGRAVQHRYKAGLLRCIKDRLSWTGDERWIFVMDYDLEPGGWGCRALKRALHLAAGKGHLIVCGASRETLAEAAGAAVESGPLQRLLRSPAAGNLILVGARSKVRPAHTVCHHRARFVFGEGVETGDRDLSASGVYAVAEALARLEPAILEAESNGIPPELLDRELEGSGMAARRIGGVIAVFAREALP